LVGHPLIVLPPFAWPAAQDAVLWVSSLPGSR